MDPYMLAMLASTLAQAATPKPQMPGAPNYAQFAPPDRSQYENQMLNNAFNPNSTLYDLANKRMMEDINSQMVNRGLANSSLGIASLNNASSDLYNKFMGDSVNRQTQAFNSATGYDLGRSRMMAGLQDQSSQGDWRNYEAQNQGISNTFGGINSLINAGFNSYNTNQMMDMMKKNYAQNNMMFANNMGYQPTATGGYGSYSPGLQMPPNMLGASGNYVP